MSAADEAPPVVARSGSTTAGRGVGPFGVWAFAFAVMSVLCVLWALACPVFSVPDENAHAR